MWVVANPTLIVLSRKYRTSRHKSPRRSLSGAYDECQMATRDAQIRSPSAEELAQIRGRLHVRRMSTRLLFVGNLATVKIRSFSRQCKHHFMCTSLMCRVTWHISYNLTQCRHHVKKYSSDKSATDSGAETLYGASTSLFVIKPRQNIKALTIHQT